MCVCVCVRMLVCVIESLHFVANVHAMSTRNVCPPQAPPFQNPFGISLSLSLSLFSSTSLFFAQYIITTVLGFLWFEVYKLFLWSITQSLCIYNYKLCSGYLLFCQSLSFCWIIYSFDKFVQILLMSFFFFDFVLINI